MSSDDHCDFLFKIVLIGDCNTGKTCVIQRFKTGTYVDRHGNTIGVDFAMKNLVVDGKKVKVRKYSSSYYRNVANFYYLESHIIKLSNKSNR